VPWIRLSLVVLTSSERRADYLERRQRSSQNAAQQPESRRHRTQDGAALQAMGVQPDFVPMNTWQRQSCRSGGCERALGAVAARRHRSGYAAKAIQQLVDCTRDAVYNTLPGSLTRLPWKACEPGWTLSPLPAPHCPQFYPAGQASRARSKWTAGLAVVRLHRTGHGQTPAS